MTISKKLYLGFGSIVVVLVLLFVTNAMVVLRQRTASQQTAVALQSVQTLEAVQFRLTQNRVTLQNYLLTGDVREKEKLTQAMRDLNALIGKERTEAPTVVLRDVLMRLDSHETDWTKDFAAPLIAARSRVDGGDATVADLQIAYLEKDPNSWSAASTAILDEANADIRKAFRESTASAATAFSVGTTVSTLMTVLAVVLCAAIAFRTAR